MLKRLKTSKSFIILFSGKVSFQIRITNEYSTLHDATAFIAAIANVDISSTVTTSTTFVVAAVVITSITVVALVFAAATPSTTTTIASTVTISL